MTEKAAHMPELWACNGLINLDPFYRGSILFKGKSTPSTPHNSGITAPFKVIFWLLVSPYPTTTMCKISCQKGAKFPSYCSLPSNGCVARCPYKPPFKEVFFVGG